MNASRRSRVITVLLAACVSFMATVGPAAADIPPSTHDLEVLKAQLDSLAGQGKAGGAQFWYVDRAAVKVQISVLTSAVDPVTAAFIAVATARPELASVIKIDVAIVPLVGHEPTGKQAPAASVIYGGQRINAANGGYCTSGFNAQNSSGGPVVLTAGHCVKAGKPNWVANGALLGSITDYDYPNADWSAITPNAGWAQPNAVQTANGIQQITAFSTPRVGQSICKTGATSNTTCGSVTAINVTVNYGDGPIYGLAQTSMYAAEGDSGGSVYDGATGVALISGGPKGGGNAFVQPLSF